MLREYETVLLALEKDATNEKVQGELFRLQQQMDAMNAWDANANAKALLTKLGIADFSAKVGELSGGQKKSGLRWRKALFKCQIFLF
ncbi:hypothetical protein GCM10020331_065830 [Ectobacillus funiculus]